MKRPLQRFETGPDEITTQAGAEIREDRGPNRASSGDHTHEVAGIFEGASEGELDEPLARCAARLCWLAGADPEAIPAWIEERRRPQVGGWDAATVRRHTRK